MKVKIIIASLMLSLNLHAHEMGDMVKCQGYVERPSEERTYYELNGKILKVLGRHYMIYGYTPVFKSKRLHKVLKISCVLPDEDFIENVVEVKEELVDVPAITVARDPGINLGGEVFEASEKEIGVVDDELSETNASIVKSAPEPIHIKAPVKIAQSDDLIPETRTTKSPEGCKNLSKQGFVKIIKCFVKDGYGSF